MQLFGMKSRRQIITVTILAIVAMLFAACGADSGGATGGAEDVEGARKIDPDRILTLDDFKAAGFKKDKTYDVSELPGAEAAYYGFWGPDPSNRDDFEFRIYASQADAIELGDELAAQRTGPDALLTKDTTVWQVGIKDARTCAGRSDEQFIVGGCTFPKYADYMFVGNVILFCPGRELNVAQENLRQTPGADAVTPPPC